jgi:hypothetical protein
MAMAPGSPGSPGSWRATFHAVPEAEAAIVDESIEPYVSLLARREAEFMTGQPIAEADGHTARFAAMWRSAVRGWTADEEAGVRRALGLLYTALGPFPAFAQLEWRFVKTRRGFCGGMAHTRHREIIFDASMAERFAQGRAEDTARLVGLLAHEQLHVLQRDQPAASREFFLRLWGGRGAGAARGPRLVCPARLEPCRWLADNQVTNPDGVELPYLIELPCAGGGHTWLWPRTIIDPDATITTDAAAPKPNSPQGVFMGCAVEMAVVPDPGAAAAAGGVADAVAAASFRPVFSAEQRRHASVEALMADPSAVPAFRDLDALLAGGEAAALFPAGYAHDHPNEVSAYLFADMVKLALEKAGALPPELSDAHKATLEHLVPEFSAWLQLAKAKL